MSGLWLAHVKAAQYKNHSPHVWLVRIPMPKTVYIEDSTFVARLLRKAAMETSRTSGSCSVIYCSTDLKLSNQANQIGIKNILGFCCMSAPESGERNLRNKWGLGCDISFY